MAAESEARRGEIARKTRETAISVTVDVDGTGAARISTGIGFFDHMLDQLSRHSLIDMTIEAKGDLLTTMYRKRNKKVFLCFYR